MAIRTFITNSTGTKSVDVTEILAVEMRPETRLEGGTVYRLSLSTTWATETSFETSTDFDWIKLRLAEIAELLGR